MHNVLVSGGTSTLGEAVCRSFVLQGSTVFCAYTSSFEKAKALQEELGPSLVPIHLDVCNQGSIEEALQDLVCLDVLVNNSGVFSVFDPLELTTQEWERVFDINVTGMFRLTKACIPLLRVARGNIVNIASINAFHPGFGGTAHYDASKGAVVSYTRSLAQELGPEIRVNAVAPGLLEAAYLDQDNELRRQYEQRSLLKSLVKAEQVAQVVLLLSSCTAITAEVVTVDCGYIMG